MTGDQAGGPAMPSRRRVLGGAVLAAGGVVAVAAFAPRPAAAAQVKTSQKVASYQPKPMGSARCDKCSSWQPPAACKIVDGVISPSGWCSLYAPHS